jgi:hypothetical protein
MIRIWELCDDNDEPESFDVYCTKGMENGGNTFVKAITMEQKLIISKIKEALSYMINQ